MILLPKEFGGGSRNVKWHTTGVSDDSCTIQWVCHSINCVIFSACRSQPVSHGQYLIYYAVNAVVSAINFSTGFMSCNTFNEFHKMTIPNG